MALRMVRVAALALAAGWVTAVGAQGDSAPGHAAGPGTTTPVGQSSVLTLERVAISQVVSTPPDVKVYLDVRGPTDTPMEVPPAEAIEARMDGKVLPVRSLKPFSETREGIAYVSTLR